MIKKLDKPYIYITWLVIMLIFGVILIKGYTNDSKQVKPTVNTEEIINAIIENSKVSEPVTKSVSIKSTKVILSRGGTPSKRLSERETINMYVKSIAEIYNMDPYLIMSIIQTESEYKSNARVGNCIGLMQVSSRWHKDRARRLGVTDFYDPYSNILIGVDYLSELKEQYKDMRLVLMLYNMDHNTAIGMYKKGHISVYAKTILSRANVWRKGE